MRAQRRAGMSGQALLDDFGDDVADLVDMANGGDRQPGCVLRNLCPATPRPVLKCRSELCKNPCCAFRSRLPTSGAPSTVVDNIMEVFVAWLRLRCQPLLAIPLHFSSKSSAALTVDRMSLHDARHRIVSGSAWVGSGRPPCRALANGDRNPSDAPPLQSLSQSNYADCRNDGIDAGFRRFAVSQRFGGDLAAASLKARSGDDDLPLREPLHERRAKYDAVRARQTAGDGSDDAGDVLPGGALQLLCFGCHIVLSRKQDTVSANMIMLFVQVLMVRRLLAILSRGYVLQSLASGCTLDRMLSSIIAEMYASAAQRCACYGLHYLRNCSEKHRCLFSQAGLRNSM